MKNTRRSVNKKLVCSSHCLRTGEPEAQGRAGIRRPAACRTDFETFGPAGADVFTDHGHALCLVIVTDATLMKNSDASNELTSMSYFFSCFRSKRTIVCFGKMPFVKPYRNGCRSLFCSLNNIFSIKQKVWQSICKLLHKKYKI